MSKRAKKITDFANNYARVRGTKKSVELLKKDESPTTLGTQLAGCLPVTRYMLSEQEYIREFGYYH